MNANDSGTTAECPYCGQDMNEADSCSKNIITEPNGDWFYAIPYGQEGDRPAKGRCHDCGVKPGGTHHPGCDVEQHPENGRQLLIQVVSQQPSERPVHGRIEADPHSDVTLEDVRGGASE